MKKLATTIIFATSCLFLTACNSNPVEPTPTPTPKPAPQPPMAGGLASVDVNSPEVQAAAQFAAQALGGLLAKVTKAEQQVVAGMNYKMSLELKDGSKHDVVVYKNLQGQMQLTSKN